MNDGKDDGQQLVESNGQDVKASCRCGNIRITSGDDLDGKPFHIHRVCIAGKPVQEQFNDFDPSDSGTRSSQ